MGRVFTALAGIRSAADPVHRNIERAMRLRGERAKRHAGRDEARQDIVYRLNLVQGDRPRARAKIQQMAQRDRALGVDARGIFLVEVIGIPLHRCLEQMNHFRAVSVQFS